MALADLSGLTKLKTVSQGLVDTTSQEDDEEFTRTVQRALYGETGSLGPLAGVAAKGYGVGQPDTHKVAAKAVSYALDDLAQQRFNRQLGALGAARELEMTEPQFRLQESIPTGMYGGAPTLSAELGRGQLQLGREQLGETTRQFDVLQPLREAEITGTFGGAPTLASRSLEQQATLTREQYALQRDLLAQELQSRATLQGQQLEWQAAQNEADRILKGRALDQTEQELQAKYSGYIGGQPTVQRWEAQARMDEATEAREWLKQQAYAKQIGDVAGALGIPQWLAQTLFGVGAPGAGAGGGLVGGALGTAGAAAGSAVGKGLVQKGWDALFGAGAGAGAGLTGAQIASALNAGIAPAASYIGGPGVPLAITPASQFLGAGAGGAAGAGSGAAAAGPGLFGPPAMEGGELFAGGTPGWTSMPGVVGPELPAGGFGPPAMEGGSGIATEAVAPAGGPSAWGPEAVPGAVGGAAPFVPGVTSLFSPAASAAGATIAGPGGIPLAITPAAEFAGAAGAGGAGAAGAAGLALPTLAQAAGGIGLAMLPASIAGYFGARESAKVDAIREEMGANRFQEYQQNPALIEQDKQWLLDYLLGLKPAPPNYFGTALARVYGMGEGDIQQWLLHQLDIQDQIKEAIMSGRPGVGATEWYEDGQWHKLEDLGLEKNRTTGVIGPLGSWDTGR